MADEKTPPAERRAASEWCALKSTDKAMYRVARATGFRADNRLMTESEYDDAIKRAGSFQLR